MIQAALPALRESRGRILNISSAAAVFSIPFQSFYSATKAAVESLTCALRSELAPFGITVGALRLGDVKTGLPPPVKRVAPVMICTPGALRAAWR